MNFLNNLTQEDRQTLKVKADLARKIKQQEGTKLKQDFNDLKDWKELASRYNFRLPVSYIKCSETRKVNQLFKLLEVDGKEFWEYHELKGQKEFARLNPTWPCYALCGLILEWYNECCVQ